MVFLSGGWMHNNVKFALRDEDIQVWWGQLIFRFILGLGVCAFPRVLGIEKSKKIAAHPLPLRIISRTALWDLWYENWSQISK